MHFLKFDECISNSTHFRLVLTSSTNDRFSGAISYSVFEKIFRCNLTNKERHSMNNNPYETIFCVWILLDIWWTIQCRGFLLWKQTKMFIPSNFFRMWSYIVCILRKRAKSTFDKVCYRNSYLQIYTENRRIFVTAFQ